MEAAIYFLGHPTDHFFSEGHQVFIGGICLIEFQHGKFWIVLERYPFIAKISIYLKNPLEATHQEALEIQFRSDSKIQVNAQGIVKGLERTCSGSTGNRLHHWGLHLNETVTLEEFLCFLKNLGSLDENLANVVVYHEIHIALTVPGFDVTKPVPFFG